MSLYVLNKDISFPPVNDSEPDGLLAIGGDLSTKRLLHAYHHGIFPWYEGDYILWWCPDPRFVLIPPELKISKSMRSVMNKRKFDFTVNGAFTEVIRNCKNIIRHDQDGTWITNEIEKAYTELYRLGYAFSAEAWHHGKLAGGLYGVRLGKVFFGESMFSLEDNASKFAFINYVDLLMKEGVELIDCQVYTAHLESLGAKMIPRDEFTRKLEELVGEKGKREKENGEL
jgi:leucyl/phenylalanyl-tRNA--protein transferase